MREVEGYKFFGPEEYANPTQIHLDLALGFLIKTDLPFKDEADLAEGASIVGTMLATSEETLRNAAEGRRHAEDIDVNDKVIVALSEKKGEQVSSSLHFLESNAGNVIIETFMGYTGSD